MKTSDQINEIAKAMAEAQNKIRPALKDGTNPHFKSKYTSIASVWESLREPMTSNGLTVWQDVTTTERGVSVDTRIVHSSGQWVEFGPLTMPVGKADAQGFGSCISYAKRYALCAAIGIVSGDEDDDAQGTVDRGTGEVKEAKPVGIVPLSDLQKQKIQALLDAIKDSEYTEKLCKFMNVKDLRDIPAKDFDRVIGSLEKKVGE
jgi:hypothetical protein